MKKENGVLTGVTNKDLKLLEENPAKFWEGVTIIWKLGILQLSIFRKNRIARGTNRN